VTKYEVIESTQKATKFDVLDRIHGIWNAAFTSRSDMVPCLEKAVTCVTKRSAQSSEVVAESGRPNLLAEALVSLSSSASMT
jgi:hypothetical protein